MHGTIVCMEGLIEQERIGCVVSSVCLWVGVDWLLCRFSNVYVVAVKYLPKTKIHIVLYVPFFGFIFNWFKRT